MSEIKTYQGKLLHRDHGEGVDILFLSSEGDPLADVLMNDISGRQVTARYWLSDREITREEAEELTIRQVMGDASVDFGHCYSEITGYLWTNEKIEIGGHDLLGELNNALGKWLILEVEIHDSK